MVYRPGQDGSPGQHARRGIRGSGGGLVYRQVAGGRTPEYRDVADARQCTLHCGTGHGGRSPSAREDSIAPVPTYRRSSKGVRGGKGVGDRIVVQRAWPIVTGTRHHARVGASGPGGWLWAHSQEEPPGFVRCRRTGVLGPGRWLWAHSQEEPPGERKGWSLGPFPRAGGGHGCLQVADGWTPEPRDVSGARRRTLHHRVGCGGRSPSAREDAITPIPTYGPRGVAREQGWGQDRRATCKIDRRRNPAVQDPSSQRRHGNSSTFDDDVRRLRR